MKIKPVYSLLSTIVFFITYISSTGVYAQADNPDIKFEKSTHDFGHIKEENGPVSYEFKFVNDGKSPLVVQNVRPSCGCTTPDWTREPILPGKTGYIKAVFNPLHRPGAFNKSLTITTNANPAITRVYIKGVVEPKPRTIADDYPTKIGDIRVKYRSFNFGKVTTEKPVTRSFDVYNDSDHPVTFLDDMKIPDNVKVSFDPNTIEPKKIGKIVVTYDPTQKMDLGFVTGLVQLKTDESENNIKDFRIVASVEEYFPPMTADQLALAPKLSFENTEYDFGSIQQGDEVSTDFVFTNAGKSDLKIRETKASCGCTVSTPEKTTLKPGESSVIKVTFNSRGRRGIQQKSISVFSNDPANPTQRIVIKAKVEDSQG